MQRTLAIARAEVLRLLRDRTALALIFTVPAMQVLLFGGAVQLNPTHVPIAIAGDAGRPAVRDAVERTGRFQIVADGLPAGGAEALLRAGGVLVGLEARLPDLADPDAPIAPTRVLADGANPQEVGPALAALETGYLRARLAKSDPIGPPPPELTKLYNPDGLTSWTIMPGLTGVVVMISSLLLGTLSLVRERDQGQWEALLASPASTGDLVAGKLVPYVAIAPVQAGIVLAVAHLGFGVPAVGAVWALVAASALFALAHLLLGFAISASARTQIQAIQLAVFFYLPCMLLSGFMFPFAAMPGWARWVGSALPLTHFVRAARDVLLKGADAGAVSAHMWPVAAFSLAAGAAAYIACGRRLE